MLVFSMVSVILGADRHGARWEVRKKSARGHKMMGVVLREQLQLISANHNISNIYIYQIHIYMYYIYICIING